MRSLHPILLRDTAVIPHSFELFYAATVMRTLATVLRTPTDRHVASRATQYAYTVMLTRWREQQERTLPENARHVAALAVRAAADLDSRDGHAGPAPRIDRGPETPDEWELAWFDIRDGLRELALSTHQQSTPDALFSALVVNDDPLVREPIAARLRRMGAGTVHETATVTETLVFARAAGPCDLAVVDLELPDGGGLDLVTELHGYGWRRIVVLASPGNRHAVPLAFQAGAQCCLLKPQRSEGPAAPPDPPLPATTHALSTREVEVLQLVAAGQSNREIGLTLNLSALTVKSHLSRIGRKLGAGDRARMVVQAMRARIIR